MARFGISLGRLCAIAALVMLGQLHASRAMACPPGSVTVTIGSVNLGAYNPFNAQLLRTVPISIKNNSNAACDLSLSFKSATDPARMLNGASALSYSIENAGNTKSIIYTAALPTNVDRVNFNNVAAGATVNRNVDVIVAAGQVVADGLYTDPVLSLDVFNRVGNALTLIKSTPSSVSATVQKVCRLDAPAQKTLAFGANDISNGRPNAGVHKSTSMTASCTAPTRVRLSGAALQPTVATPTRTGFDNFINYRAVGTFGGATSTLNTTTTAASADSASKNTGSGATPNGTVSVDVNLVPGNPVIAGSYSGILTVTVDPDL
jgi:hypothetical protein